MTLLDHMSKLPTTLPLLLTSPLVVDTRTLALRLMDWRMADWATTTQAWSWEAENGAPDGDMLVVLTGTLGRTRAYAAIRIGDYLTVQEISYGVAGWFQSWGITVTVKAPIYNEECAA
jgi:hypothetical protein